jgi:hypothetical protein
VTDRPTYASVEFSTLSGVLRHIRIPAPLPVAVLLDDTPDTHRRTVLVRVLDPVGHAAHLFTVRQEPGAALTVTLDEDGTCTITLHAPDPHSPPQPDPRRGQACKARPPALQA